MEDGTNLQFLSPHHVHTTLTTIPGKNEYIFHSFFKYFCAIHFLIFFFVYFLSKQINSIKIHPSRFDSMDNLLVNRVNRRRRNLPAELKVEIVDCLPLENAVHFLANVPNRLIIHHCAPRIRAMMPKMPEYRHSLLYCSIDQIVIGFARTLRATDSNRNIWLENGHNYTPEIDIFIRYCSAHCDSFGIFRGAIDGLVGYPANFFDDLIKYFHETKVPGKVVRHLNIDLPFENPAPWPAALVQTGARKIKLEEMDVIGKKFVFSILRNKHNPGIAFKVFIFSEGGAKCYQQMTRFGMIMDG